MIKSILFINAFVFFILPSWYRIAGVNEFLYVSGVAPRYYTLESSYQKARENAIDEINKMNSFRIIGEKGWLSDKDYTVYGGSDLSIEWDTIYNYSDSTLIPFDSLVLDSFVYYVYKIKYKYKIPKINNKWWENLPNTPGWVFAIGVYIEPYRAVDGWAYSSFRARMNLADYFIKLKSFNKQSDNYRESILVEKYNIELKNSIILARHYEKGTYYTLAGVPIDEIFINEKDIK